VSVIAAIRPDDVNLPLFLHVLGAMLLVGVMLTVAIAFVMSARSEPDGARMTRFGLRTMLFAAFPTYLLMRVGAQWTESQEDLPDDFEATWLDIGYITADLGALLIIASMVLSARGLRRLAADGGVAGQARAVGIISVVLLVAYLVAVFAMSAKP
jgi:hypothetical protein